MSPQVENNNKEYITLDQLNKKRSYRRTIVRLARKWEARNLKKNNELIGMNFLLLDEKENTIQGFVHHSLIQKFGDQLCEGSLIEICNFNVQDCNKHYKVSDHKFQMILTERTIIANVDQQFCKIPLENFRFRNHGDLSKLKNMTQDLYDIIGYIKNIEKSDVRTQTTPTLRRVTLTLLLEGGFEIQATIWAEQAEQLEDKYRGVESDNIVLIMTSVLIKIYQGQICLSASSATKFYLNRDFDSVAAFRKSFSYDGGCFVNLGGMIEQPSKNNTISEPLHSINDIWEFISADVSQKKTFVCKAIITEIVSHKGWNYISCSNCSTKLIKSGSSLNCKKCGKSQSVGVLSFRIEVIVDDGNDSATFVIFDKEGSEIIGTTAEDLKNNDGEQLLKNIPKRVHSIVGETYLFEITIKEKDFEGSYQTFTVSKILKHYKPIADVKKCNTNFEDKQEETEEHEEPTGNLKKKARIEI